MPSSPQPKLPSSDQTQIGTGQAGDVHKGLGGAEVRWDVCATTGSRRLPGHTQLQLIGGHSSKCLRRYRSGFLHAISVGIYSVFKKIH